MYVKIVDYSCKGLAVMEDSYVEYKNRHAKQVEQNITINDDSKSKGKTIPKQAT